MYLANKYRPSTIEEVVLSDRTLFENVADNIEEINSIIIAGPSGSGKTTIARILAERKGGFFAETDCGTSGTAEIRNLTNNAASSFKPYTICLDEVQALTAPAWSSLLKTLESDKRTLFIFCTTNPEKIPDTIKSRALQLDLDPLSIDQIKARLEYVCKEEGFPLDLVDYIALSANGNMRKALVNLNLAKKLKFDENAVKKAILVVPDEAIANFCETLSLESIDQLEHYDINVVLEKAMKYLIEKKDKQKLTFLLSVVRELRYLNKFDSYNYLRAKVLTR